MQVAAQFDRPKFPSKTNCDAVHCARTVTCVVIAGMKAHSIIATLILGTALACGSVTAQEGETFDAGPLPPALAGAWVVESGGLVRTNAELGGQQLTHVEFIATEGNPNGVATIYTEDQIGVRGCEDILYAPLGDGAISLSITNFGLVRLRLIRFEDEDTVIFSDESGEETRMTRADVVPATSACKTLGIEKSYPIEDFRMEQRSGLVYDGSVLHFEDQGNTYQVFNPSSELLLAALPVPSGAGQYSHMGAFQSGEFWASCGCGNNTDVKRAPIATGTSTYTIDTEDDLGVQAGIIAIGFGDNRLFIVGYNYGTGDPTIFEVNVTAAVPVLTNTYILGTLNVDAISLRGSELWILISQGGGQQSLVRFDRGTGRAVDNFNLEGDAEFSGLAFVGMTAFLAGNTPDGNSVIVRMEAL